MTGSESDLRFELLGALCVIADGRQVPIRLGRERVVLAALLLHAGRVVPAPRLAQVIWGDDPPPTARNLVQTSVSRLRRRLAECGLSRKLIATDPAGYRVTVDPEQVDIHRFRGLVAQARAAVAAGRPAEARDTYRAAVGLWQGPALAGVDSDVLRELADGLEAEREQALEECLEAELALGGAGELIGELTELVRQQPYRERLHASLMRALYRAGRPGDGLAAYRQARQLFQDELGTEPGEQLQKLHHAILNRDPDLEVVASGPVARHVPAGLRELPVEASCFVGRDRELVRLRGVLAPADRSIRRRPPLVVLYGPGGIGKSALAVRAAYELAAGYPDGQLYVDLCGSTPGVQPVAPAEVLGRFLRRLGVHPSEVPTGQAEAAALFRSVIADRRLLLVLDNAADKEQVTDLIPSAPTCAVIITCRHPLPTLDADDRPRLGALPERDGLALLAGVTDRLVIEPGAAREIVALCDGLPLAIRIAAGRLACRPDLPGIEYAQRLADRSRRLDELQLDDLAVRASIRTSYDALLVDDDPAAHRAARVFRMLGLLHVPDVEPGVVAAMLAEEVESARIALDRLVDAQLLEPAPGGRFRLHDLVRLVAAERATEDQSSEDSYTALERGIAFYTGSLWRAGALTRPFRVLPFGEPPLPASLDWPDFTDAVSARDWIDTELENLKAALAQAVALPGDAGRLPMWLSDRLWEHLDIRCDWLGAYRVSQLTLDGGIDRRDPELTALGYLLRGRSAACVGSYDAAEEFLRHGLEVFHDLGNVPAVARVLNGLGLISERKREPLAALNYYGQALDFAISSGLAGLAASIQSNMIVSYAMLGRYGRAIAVGKWSPANSSTVGDGVSRATAELNLSGVYCLLGDRAEATRSLERVLAFSRVTGDRVRACEGLVIRSEVHLRHECNLEALMDADRARALAEASDYRHALAAAEHQRSKALSALGRLADADHAAARAEELFASLNAAFRDSMVDLVLQRDLLVPAGGPAA